MTDEVYWYWLPINPEPWAIGELGVGKRGKKAYPYMSPNKMLEAYQNAVREELDARDVQVLELGEYDVKFFFWRRLDEYELPSGRKSTRHVVDATNMQKGLEDALQKYLIDNDRNVRRISSEIVAQNRVVTRPGTAIRLTRYDGFDDRTVPDFIWTEMHGHQDELPTASTWQAPGESMF